MFVSVQMTRIFKYRQDHLFRLAFCMFGTRFVYFIDAIGFGIGDDVLSSIPPGNPDDEPVGQASSRKYAQCLVAGNVAAPTEHLLHLGWHRSTDDFDPGANPECVGGLSSQSHRDARRG